MSIKLLELNTDTLLLVLNNLPAQETARLAMTCRQLRNLIKNYSYTYQHWMNLLDSALPAGWEALMLKPTWAQMPSGNSQSLYHHEERAFVLKNAIDCDSRRSLSEPRDSGHPRQERVTSHSDPYAYTSSESIPIQIDDDNSLSREAVYSTDSESGSSTKSMELDDRPSKRLCIRSSEACIPYPSAMHDNNNLTALTKNSMNEAEIAQRKVQNALHFIRELSCFPSVWRNDVSIQIHDDPVWCFILMQPYIVGASWDNKISVTHVPQFNKSEYSNKGLFSCRLIAHEDWVLSLEYDDELDTLASGGKDCSICLWKHFSRQIRSQHKRWEKQPVQKMASFQPILRLHGHTDWVFSLKFLSNGILASGSRDGTLRTWNAETGEALMIYNFGTTAVWSVIPNVRYSVQQSSYVNVPKDEPLTFLSTFDGRLCILNSQLQVIRTLQISAEALWSIKFDERSEEILIACLDGHVYALTATLRLKRYRALLPDQQSPTAVMCVDASESRIVGGCQDHTIHVWDRHSMQQIGRLVGHEGWLLECILIGNTCVSASYDGTIRVWSLKTMLSNSCIRAHHNRITRVQLQYGHFITASHDGTIKLWTPTQPIRSKANKAKQETMVKKRLRNGTRRSPLKTTHYI